MKHLSWGANICQIDEKSVEKAKQYIINEFRTKSLSKPAIRLAGKFFSKTRYFFVFSLNFALHFKLVKYYGKS